MSELSRIQQFLQLSESDIPALKIILPHPPLVVPLMTV